ncbi:hypothetical protein LRR81_09770 [Metabacillus sp. GX 13764]|uniref:hypothetical protein n=1 Tax=Metabacillus kandeliae TaxID=2900151 RepID=UPI001E3917B4|nr:hypothetical protein [Metabacillus kandeliae]MCD7034526.1 hypothetical protein [Metabacillus kandeliae]
MAVKDLIYDNNSISWVHRGKKITRKLSDIFFASDEPSGIYAECGKNFIQTAIYEFSNEGTILFAHDRMLGTATWLHNGCTIKIQNASLTEVKSCFDHKLILAIDKVKEKLIGISLDGSILFETPPPAGYSFYRLSETEGLPSIVCEGGEDEDKYGRCQWHFVVNPVTGGLKRGTFSY